MGYPDRVLAEDEAVVEHLHPHWKALVLPVLVLLLAAGLVSFAYAASHQAALRYAVLALGLLAVSVWTVVPFLRWRTTHFVLTTHRVLLRHGILARSGRDVPLSRVNDISFQHNLFERMLGCGTLTVESAGERGQVVLADVPHVVRVQGTLYQLVEDDAERREPGRRLPTEPGS